LVVQSLLCVGLTVLRTSVQSATALGAALEDDAAITALAAINVHNLVIRQG
jgi:hypothetical protein